MTKDKIEKVSRRRNKRETQSSKKTFCPVGCLAVCFYVVASRLNSPRIMLNETNTPLPAEMSSGESCSKIIQPQDLIKFIRRANPAAGRQARRKKRNRLFCL